MKVPKIVDKVPKIKTKISELKYQATNKKDQTVEKLKKELDRREKELRKKTSEFRKKSRKIRKKAIEEISEKKRKAEVKTRAAIQFQRWSYYISFVFTFMGYFLAKRSIVKYDLMVLMGVFLIFGPLLYGGLYTLNDIFDLKYDVHNPKKKKRPLVANTVTRNEALTFAVISILFAFFLVYILEPNLMVFLILFILINIMYSWKLKHIPVIDIIANSVTHPLRVYLGYVAAGRFVLSPVLLTVFACALSFATLRREKDKKLKREKARPTLNFYGPKIFKTLYASYFVLFAFSLIFMDHVELGVSAVLFFLSAAARVWYFRSPLIRRISDIIRF